MSCAIYNNLLSNFEPKYTTKYAHNTTELRSVVKKIRKQAQESPVYMLNFTDKKQSFVLGVKEAAMKITNSLYDLADDSSDGLFQQRKAQSSDPSQVEAELVAKDDIPLPEEFFIQVKNLAKTQVNQGKEYYTTGKGLEAGSYRFRVTVNEVDYDFQYNIRKDANHEEVMNGLSDFITKAKIGLEVHTVSSSKDKMRMRLESLTTGAPNGTQNFSLSDISTDVRGRGVVSYYGLDRMESAPENAQFTLNGVEKSSLSNEIVLGRAVRVRLHSTSEENAHIAYYPDSEKILKGIEGFVMEYNNLIDESVQYEDFSGVKSKLLREMNGILEPHKNELEACGISTDDKGRLVIEEGLASQAIEEGEMQKIFAKDSGFVLRMVNKCDSVKINPMEYIDKRIVSYPDYSKPARGYSYISSLYSGLLFNSYC